MRKEVEEFLSKRAQAQLEAQQKEREGFLIRQGLCRTILMPKGGNQEEYPDFDSDTGERCRREALALTEEEYAAVRGAVVEKPAKSWPVWPVHKILFVLAMITWAGGFVLGLVSGYQADQMMGGYGGFSLAPAASISVWFASTVYGAVLLTASEIVRLMKKSNGET